MKYTNINILDDNRRFKYIVEYQDNTEFVNADHLNYSIRVLDDYLRVDFFNDGQDKYARNDNYWINYNENRIDPETGIHLDNLKEYIPDLYNVSSVNLYFPQNSVESFTNNNLYALTINTWIHGHIVYLGTYIIDRRDAIACKRETKFLNTRYFEYINIKFIDPWYLTYSEEWKNFRQEICGETEVDEYEQNNTGSVLNFTLYPIEWNEDKYIKLDPYIGGQNAINMSDNVSDYIGCDINLDTSNITFEKIVRATIRFNQDYNTDGVQTFDDFKQYLKETYDINEDVHLQYNLLVVDKENMYKVISKKVDDLYCEFTRDDIAFDNWDGWKEGLRFILNVDIYDDSIDDEEEYIMLLRSNTISITQDVMKYFVGYNPLNYVNLTLVDMNNYNINAVNKIEKKIVQLERPNDNKANLIKPVYYRVRELSNIIIHPAVTENICINLDAYKSTVEVFYAQVEGVNFVESARTNAGVIFKIVGADLSGEVGEGTFYILNQDRELVTTGKYKYEN